MLPMTRQADSDTLPSAAPDRASTAPSSEDQRVSAEWHGVVHGTPPEVRQVVARWLEAHNQALVTRYLEYLERDAETASFVASADSRARFDGRLREWLIHLFCDSATPIEAVVASQRLLGEALARMNYPIRSTLRGGRRMKAWILGGLAGCGLTESGLLQAAAYVSNLIDMSIELRNAVFLHEATHQSRIDEAYRLHALGQNIAMERERQRAALMEWGHAVLVVFHRAPSRRCRACPSRSSACGCATRPPRCSKATPRWS